MKAYQTQIEEIEQALQVKQKHHFQYALLRCMLMLGVILSLYYAIQLSTVFYSLAFLSFALFCYFVKRHTKLKRTIEFQKEEIVVLQKLLARQSDDWKQEEVEESLEKCDNAAMEDLDILGSSSLFQYINMAHTPFGKKGVQQLLNHPCSTIEEIRERQKAVLELSKQEAFLHKLQVQSSLFAKHSKKISISSLEDMFEEKREGYPLWKKYILMILRILTITTGGLTLLFSFPAGYFYLLCLCNVVLSLLFYSAHHQRFQHVKNIQGVLKDYEDMIEHICSVSFQTSSLCHIQYKLQEAFKAMRRFSLIAMLLQLRYNILLFLPINAFYLFDFKCDILLYRWMKRYGSQMSTWFAAIGEMESLSSLCVITQVKETWCMPTLESTEKVVFSINDGVHPLIQESKAVANTIHTTANSYLLTGSNMSGKTTFLRMLGVNLVLLKAGAPVCAKAMHSSLLSLYTSMRVHDEVQKGISTFYAELLRIKEMVTYSDKQIPMIVFIDEIFKGTNSIDRIYCAKEVIKTLHQPWVITFVSTHDFELCDLAEDPFIQAKNYHFEEFYEDNKICFDYQLKDGKCTTTNARALMKMIGLFNS